MDIVAAPWREVPFLTEVEMRTGVERFIEWLLDLFIRLRSCEEEKQNEAQKSIESWLYEKRRPIQIGSSIARANLLACIIEKS